MPKKIKILQIIGDSSLSGGPQHVLTLSFGLKNKFDVTVACPPGPMVKELQKNHIKSFIIPMKSRADLSAIFKLRKLIKKEKFKIAHTQGSRGGSIGRLACWGLKVLVLYTEHTRTFEFKLKNPALDQIHIIGLRFLDYLTHKTIAVSEAVRQWLIKTPITESEKVITILNGIDLNRFNFDIDINKKREELNLFSSNLLICTVASLLPHKGIKYLLYAIYEVKKKIPNINLLIVGCGPQQRELEEIVEKLKIKKDVRFLGVREDVLKILKIIDVFVLPSQAEPFGLVILEAMALGKPVIGTKVGGIPEIISDQKTGILVPPGDSKALAKTIIELLTNDQKAKHMGEAGRRRVEKYFTSQAMVEKTENLYKKLLQGQKNENRNRCFKSSL